MCWRRRRRRAKHGVDAHGTVSEQRLVACHERNRGSDLSFTLKLYTIWVPRPATSPHISVPWIHGQPLAQRLPAPSTAHVASYFCPLDPRSTATTTPSSSFHRPNKFPIQPHRSPHPSSSALPIQKHRAASRLRDLRPPAAPPFGTAPASGPGTAAPARPALPATGRAPFPSEVTASARPEAPRPFLSLASGPLRARLGRRPLCRRRVAWNRQPPSSSLPVASSRPAATAARRPSSPAIQRLSPGYQRRRCAHAATIPACRCLLHGQIQGGEATAVTAVVDAGSVGRSTSHSLASSISGVPSVLLLAPPTTDHPVNLLLLGLFTVAISFAVGLNCAFIKGEICHAQGPPLPLKVASDVDSL